MDVAQTLLKMVLRAFYETRQIIVVDAVMAHSALRDDDLAYIMSMNIKDLHKLVAKLKEERLVHQFNRPEIREGQARPVTRIYYYIDYRQAIDAIKWRVYTITKEIQGTTVPASEKKEYFCKRCNSAWTQMEVLDNVGPNGFVCHRCGSLLVHDLERNSVGHEQSTRLNNQFKFITDLLQQIDRSRVPDNNFETALASARPVERDASHPSSASTPVDLVASRPTAVKGLTITGPRSMAVSISASDGPSEAEKEAEKLRKEKIAQQNALPSWMSNSTVTGESFSGLGGQSTQLQFDDVDEKDQGIHHSFNEKDHADIDDLFARLKAEQERKEQEEEEYEEEEDDDDEEEDFEDVVPTGENSSGATPMDSSKMALAVDGDDKVVKKVKVETPPLTMSEDAESEEEDVEFEDV